MVTKFKGTRLLLIITSLAILMVFLTGCVSKSNYDNALSQISSLQTNLANANSSRDTAVQNLATSNQENNSLKSQVTSLQTNLSNVQTLLTSTQQSLTATITDRDSYKTQLATAQASVTAIQSTLIKAQSDLNTAQANLKLYQDTGISVYKDITPNINTTAMLGFGNLTLSRNSNAHDPTWSELMNFLQKDNTSQQPYGTNLCGWFAEQVFNNAENEGIRAAFVIVDFQQGAGHGLNAFKTTDKGLVYVDCTGKSIFDIRVYLPNTIVIGDTPSYDKIAYIVKDKPMGLITFGTSYGLSYSDFERWQKDVQTMRGQFNAAQTNNELYSLKAKSDSQLGSFWECPSTPDNIVKSIEIYW